MSVTEGSPGIMESSRVWRYGIAVLSVVVAVAVRLTFDPLIASGHVLIFTLAVMVAARVGGRGPGLLASALSVPLAWYFFIEPRFSFGLPNRADAGSLVVLAGVSIGFSLLDGHPPPSPHLGAERQTDTPFLRRAILFGSAFLVLGVLTSLLYADFAREKDRQHWVTHSYQVLNAIQALMSNLQDAETGQRGYLLTGDESYREPFQSALREEQSVRRTLRQLTAGDPAEQASLDTVDRLVEAMFSELRKSMALRRKQGMDAALAVVRTGEGKRVMDEFSAVLSAMEEEDRLLLAKRIRAAEAQASRMRWVLGLGSGSLLILLVIAGAVIDRDSRNNERARQAVSQSGERLRLALDAANAGTWEWDLDTNESVWSEELWKLYGIEAHSRAPSHEAWREAVHPDDRANAEQVVAQAARTGTELNVEFRVCDREGTERWLLARGRPLRKGGGRTARFVGIVLDITGRKRAEEALRESEAQFRLLNSQLEQRVRQRTAQLEIANKELEAFAYSVSHDLRAPLRGIDGWSLALAEDYAGQLDERAHRYLDRVRSETQRMGLLIDDMLQLSRVTRAEMQSAPVDLTAIARSIAHGLSEANSGRHIEFVIEPGLAALGDARLLEIALTNLLSNAVKFTGPRAQARIEFAQASHNGQPAFYVRDNGVGFDMAYGDKLFSAFQRLHRTSEFPGTGIGLATVQRVIHCHAGQVWAEAQVDRGAAFYFTIGETA